MQIVNQTVPRALRRMGYAEETIEAIVEHIAEHGHVVDAPGLRPEHYEVFDTAMGVRSIAPMGHVKMMAAVQPFLSGAISKTVNLPETATVEDIEQVYFDGWKLGLKALAVYRDNCKVGQPLSSGKSAASAADAAAAAPSSSSPTPPAATPAAASTDGPPRAARKRLPKQRPSVTTSFTVGGAEGYLTAGSYPDDGLGEIFLRLGKQGSTLAGVMDAFSIAISIGLQHGVPLEIFVQKFTNLRFEPAGMTDDPEVRMAQSIMDYVFRRLALDHLPFETRSEMGIFTTTERARYAETGSYTPAETDLADLNEPVDEEPAAGPAPAAAASEAPAATAPSAPAPTRPHSSAELLELQQGQRADAPLCMSCGIKMRPSGSCYVCEGCGSTSGCS